MNLGKYIYQLLREYDTVIVPGMGAFVSAYKPAQFDEAADEIIPPSKAVSFNPSIKTNDGLLVGYVASKEGISTADAFDKLENERENVLLALDKGEKVLLENVGSLFYDARRQVQFEASEGENLLPDAFGLEATSLKEESEGETIPEREEEMKPENQEKENPGEEPAPNIPAPEAAFTGGEGVPKKKGRGWLWFLLLLLPLIGAGIYFLKKDKFYPTEKPENITTIPPADSFRAEEVIAVPPDSVKKDSLPPSPAGSVTKIPVDSVELVDQENYLKPDTTKYYLVSGSFQEKDNAKKHLEQLKEEGYNAFHLGKQGNFYIVGIDVFSNEQAAFDAQYDFLEKNPESGVWVYQVK